MKTSNYYFIGFTQRNWAHFALAFLLILMSFTKTAHSAGQLNLGLNGLFGNGNSFGNVGLNYNWNNQSDFYSPNAYGFGGAYGGSSGLNLGVSAGGLFGGGAGYGHVGMHMGGGFSYPGYPYYIPQIQYIPRMTYQPYVTYVPNYNLILQQRQRMLAQQAYYDSLYRAQLGGGIYGQGIPGIYGPYGRNGIYGDIGIYGQGPNGVFGLNGSFGHRGISPVAPIAPIAGIAGTRPMGLDALMWGRSQHGASVRSGSYRSSWWCCTGRSCKDSGKDSKKEDHHEKKETRVAKREKLENPFEIPVKPEPAPAPIPAKVEPKVVQTEKEVVERVLENTNIEIIINEIAGNKDQANVCVPVDRAPAEDPIPEVKNSCTQDNNYLEKDLALYRDKMGWKTNEFINKPGAVDVACIKGAMKRMSEVFPKGVSTVGYTRMSGYSNDDGKSCGQGKSGAYIDKNLQAPCLSDDYVTVTHNSYVEAMDCVGMDSKFLFPQIAQESGFLVNIGNWTNADRNHPGRLNSTGVGQLTGPAIKTVNDSGRFEKILKSDKASCQSFKKVIADQMNSKISMNCDRFMISEGNPGKNMLYAGVFHKMNEESVKNVLIPLVKESFGSLSAEEEKAYTEHFTRMMYNAGYAGVIDTVKNYLRNNSKKQSVADFKENFKKYVKENYRFVESCQKLGLDASDKAEDCKNSQQRRRNEVANYPFAIEDIKQSYDNKLGEGVCTN